MFNPKRLSLARKRRRLTAKALAERTGLAQDTISRLEAGSHQPDEATVTKLIRVLGYPSEFFYDADPEDIDTGAVSFRSFSKMSARERDAAIAAGSLGLQLSAWVEDRFSLPAPNLLDLSYETDPEAAAFSLRQFWGLGERPIGNLLALLETHGVRIFSLSENTASVNAFSFWRDSKPYVFLNNFKTAESSIFDAAHELGHLVMHKHGDPKETRSAEREADRFASSFLMPARDMKARVSRLVTIDTVLRAKFRWRVSAMALAYRLNALRLISDWQYKSLCIELGKRGYRLGEPNGIERETSLIWHKVLTQLWSERTTKNDIAASLHLPLDELEGLIWNLAGSDHRPDRPSTAGIRAVT
ncbi:XRE family transcriptional regulator [Mesorhizobium sp. WSM3866]|uniref:helix-turn-helix domain-containing protein n=1 Tax=Mesorhizobium sp. WSM3866 TaxID=422271 RepID=UPI000BAFAEF5|nr:ImmA/IrrE family metallo-endopeptidase [Mesorhizobium sp. WSM3866]PBB40613.1 XRE family transcriptional regulator [Mesorhizobium sp. WSM3866]